MNKKLLVGIISLLFVFDISAQYTAIYSADDSRFAEGVNLYQQGQYSASKTVLEQYVGTNFEEQKSFYLVANAFEMRDRDALVMLQQYLAGHPYTPYASEVSFMIGTLQVEKKKNKQALKEFDKVVRDELFRPHQAEYLFHKGYAYLQMNDLQKAANTFGELKGIKSKYQLQAKYYYAFTQYSLENYGKALPEFLSIEHTQQYKDIVPYYIIQIYYAQGQYDEVYERAEYLLTVNPNNENNGELHRIVGEIAYQEGRYDKAIEHLGEYEKEYTALKRDLMRNDVYLLGMSHFQLSDMQNAAKYLQNVKKQDDALTQNALYHLGLAQAKLGQTEQAKISFGAAMRYHFDEAMREEAMYNYALTTYHSSTALGESVTAFTDFLDEFPNSKYKTQIYELLCEAFRSSKNYASALDALNQIQQPDAKMQETKQYLRYQLGADAYAQGKATQAIEWFTQVIENETTVRTQNAKRYVAESYFFRAESEYKAGQYDKAKSDYESFRSLPLAKQSSNYIMSNYSLGYTLFTQGEYSKSLGYFSQFVSEIPKTDVTYADALNRMGDCFFNARDFANAETYYAKVISLGTTGADYATFQRGYVLGLMRRYEDKINVLERLVKQYASSDYADDALYEIARADLQLNKNTDAVSAYERLLRSYPNSPLAKKAQLEMAMIYYNQQNYAKAIENYKLVIKNYPGSEEAYSALDGLEAAYVETDNVAEYIAYTKQLGKQNMKIDSREDSLTYAAAERQYMLGNYSQAVAGLEKYMSQYCDGGRYCSTAQYYIADSYYQLGQKDDAMLAYKKVAELAGNPYIEEACTRVAEIAYDKQDYQTSLQYFRRLQSVAGSLDKVNIARLGVLRCSYYLNDQTSTINVASEIIDDVSSSASVVAEARYNRGKAYYDMKEYNLAINDLSAVATEARTAQGAESKYLVCEAYYKLGDLTRSEEEIMSFAAMNTQHQYWLAKSFILLADIYIQRGDLFQAKQYLLSLQSNYRNASDDILETVTDRLQLINEIQNDNVENNSNE